MSDLEVEIELWRGSYRESYGSNVYLRYVAIDHQYNGEHRYMEFKTQLFRGWDNTNAEVWDDSRNHEYKQHVSEQYALKTLIPKTNE